MIQNWLIKNIRLYAYILLFVIAIFLPSIAQVFDLDKGLELTEKRTLAQKPELSLSKKYASDFELYFNDNFGFRLFLVRIFNRLKVNVFRSSPKPNDVLAGKNQYFFYNSLTDCVYNSYAHKDIYSEKQLEKHYNRLKYRKDTLGDRGIKYVCGFFPNKHTIMHNNLSKVMQMQVTDTLSLADQLVNYLNKKDFPIFDVRQELSQAKSTMPIYLKLDSHWNKNGCFIAYQAFCKQTFDDLHLKPFNVDDFAIQNYYSATGDLVKMLGVDSVRGYSDSIPEYVLKDTTNNFTFLNTDAYPNSTVITLNENCGNRLSVLVFRDSYSGALIQFLSLHFYKIVYIWGGYTNKFIKQENPDIVISACVERYLLAL